MPVSRLHRLGRSVVLVASGLLASCAAIPDLGPRPALRGPETMAAENSLPAGATEVAWPGDGWWTGYGDPQLTALVGEGLRNAPDMAVAAARFRKAAGYAQQAGAALLPSLDAEARAGFDKQSYNNGFPKEFVPKGWLDTGRVDLNFNFDIDLWGRNRAALAAATSEE